MVELKGSKTEKNLVTAFAGESQARMKYDYFASVAKKEGYVQIQAIFEETALNEKEHAKVFFKYLKECGGEAVPLEVEFPAGFIGTTEENLLQAAEGEKHEWSSMYPDFAKVAREEGFLEIAKSFEEIAEVEEQHEKRYRKLLDNVLNGTVFRKNKVVKWRCRNCGYVHEGDEAPHICPACQHPQAHYEVLAENY